MKKTSTIVLTLSVIVLTLISILQFTYLRKIEYNLRSINTRADRTTALKLYDFEDAFLGEKNAPVEFIVFTDFECPYCRKLYQELMPALEEEYINTGKVKFIFKHLPLPYHQQGIYSAYLAEYAKEQGKFWDMYNYLYKGDDLEMQLKNINTFAQTIDLDTTGIETLEQNYAYGKAIKADEKDAVIAGITGTPAVIINQRVYGGYRTYEELKIIIEESLAEKN